MTLDQILQANTMLLDSADLRTVVAAAVRSAAVLEIWLDRDKRTYTSRFACPAAGEQPALDSLWISPLEPGQGNIAIRQAQQIRFLFYMGQYAAGGTTQFKRVENVGQEKVLTVAFPSLLRLHLQRANVRYIIPPERPCLVRASRRRELTLSGTLLDANLLGLGFEIPNPEEGFEVGESVSIEVQAEHFALPPFKVLGAVCYKRRVRGINTTTVSDHYGVSLAQNSQYMLLKTLIDKLRRLGAQTAA